jgi:hypothetical protein
MRRLAVVLVALAAAAPAVAAAPSLSLASRTPDLVVRGRSFRPHERVSVVAASLRAVVRASRAGAFVADLGSFTGSRCTGLVVRATGSAGSVAVLKLPRPACMPASQP